MSSARAMLFCCVLLGAGGAGCGSEPGPGAVSDLGASSVVTGDDQTPPMGQTALEAWLATAVYKAWACESGPMPPRPNGAHNRTRVCSNRLVNTNTGGEYAVGGASVKELFSSSDQLIGYAVSRHIKAGSTADTWYWYERSGSSLYADGVGVGLCSGCHSAAGSDASHQGHDYVYVQVK